MSVLNLVDLPLGKVVLGAAKAIDWAQLCFSGVLNDAKLLHRRKDIKLLPRLSYLAFQATNEDTWNSREFDPRDGLWFQSIVE